MRCKGIFIDPQSLKAYIYARDNPEKYVDPTGNRYVSIISGGGSSSSGAFTIASTIQQLRISERNRLGPTSPFIQPSQTSGIMTTSTETTTTTSTSSSSSISYAPALNCNYFNNYCGQVSVNYYEDDWIATAVLAVGSGTVVGLSGAWMIPPVDSGLFDADVHAVQYTQNEGNGGNYLGVMGAWGEGFVEGFFFEEVLNPSSL